MSIRYYKNTIQMHQFIILSILLAFGMYDANIYISWMQLLLILIFTLVTEHLMILYTTRGAMYFSYSSLSSAIGITLMLISTHLYVYLASILLALGQKHFIKIKNKHIFNPSNFALICALFFFYDDAHLAMGQLGDSRIFMGLVIVLSLSILIRVNRYMIPLSFLFFYVLFSYIFILSYDPVMTVDDLWHRFYSVSAIVFIVFMLTDPVTTPSNRVLQILFGISIALGAVFLDRMNGFRVQHLFISLFLFTLLFKFSFRYNTKERLLWSTLAILSLAVITNIQLQSPYYLEMDG